MSYQNGTSTVTNLYTSTASTASVTAGSAQYFAVGSVTGMSAGGTLGIDLAGAHESVTITSVLSSGPCNSLPVPCITATFANAHPSGTPVTIPSGAFTLANGSAANTSNYDDVASMWGIQYTAGTQGITCGVGADGSPCHNYAVINAHIFPTPCTYVPGTSPNCTGGNTTATSAAKIAPYAAGSVTSLANLASHVHFLGDYISTDWTDSSLVSGPFTLQAQQSNSPIAYSLSAASVMAHRLPSDVLSHLWTGSVTASNSYGKCIITDCGADPTGGAGSQWGSTSYSSYGNYGTTAFYWATSSDPWWIVNGCTYCVSGWTSGPFHAPSNMLLPGANYTGDADGQLTIWDQATGMVVSVYGAPGYTVPTYTGTCPGTAGLGTFGSPCVMPTWYSSAGAVSSFYTSRDWQSTNPSGQGNLTSSLALAPNAGMVRVNEITAGLIAHAEYDSTDCVATNGAGGSKLPAVFPGTGTPGTLACPSAKYNAYRPQEGMLYFADYTDAQLACMDPAQATCYYSDSTAIAKVQPFQMIFLTRLAHYGSYIGETSNSSTALAEYAGWHDDVATGWHAIGEDLGSPLWAWANGVEAASGSSYANCFGPRSGTNPSAETCSLSLYINIPRTPGISGANDQSGNSCTVGNGCDLSGHIQVADPCVAEGYAGVTGGCF